MFNVFSTQQEPMCICPKHVRDSCELVFEAGDGLMLSLKKCGQQLYNTTPVMLKSHLRGGGSRTSDEEDSPCLHSKLKASAGT